MSTPWTYLPGRYGSEIASPTLAQIEAAAAELFHEREPGMTEADYEEHGAATFRRGTDEGPMYLLEITRSGIARWEEWADPDFNEELSPAREMKISTEHEAVVLWMALSEGNIELIRSAYAKRAI